MMQGRTLVCPNAKTWNDLFEVWTGDKTKSPKGESWVVGHKDCPIGPYMTIRGLKGHHSLYVRAKPEVYAAVKANTIHIDYDTIFFEVVVRDDGTALVCAKNNKIIGGPWVALIDSSTLPKEIRS